MCCVRSFLFMYKICPYGSLLQYVSEYHSKNEPSPFWSFTPSATWWCLSFHICPNYNTWGACYNICLYCATCDANINICLKCCTCGTQYNVQNMLLGVPQSYMSKMLYLWDPLHYISKICFALQYRSNIRYSAIPNKCTCTAISL